MTSVYNLGCFVGAMSTVWTGDYFGRPRQILVGSTVIAVGGIIQAASYGVPQMMVGRVVAGLGTGMNTATAGVWQSETSKMSSRGKLVIIQMVSHASYGFMAVAWTMLLIFLFLQRPIVSPGSLCRIGLRWGSRSQLEAWRGGFHWLSRFSSLCASTRCARSSRTLRVYLSGKGCMMKLLRF